MLQRPGEKRDCTRNLTVPGKKARLHKLVTRYYPVLYSFAFRLVQDPQEALWLADDAFESTLKQLANCRDEKVFASMLIASLIRYSRKPGGGIFDALTTSNEISTLVFENTSTQGKI
jgi:hypothetical protein